MDTVLMIGRKIVAVISEKEKVFIHTGEHKLSDCTFRIYDEAVIADNKKGLRSDKFSYWKTTKRGRVYKARRDNLSSLIGYIPISFRTVNKMDIPVFYPLV